MPETAAIDVTIEQVRAEVRDVATELLDVAGLRSGELVVLGCSTSEIQGLHIGRHSSEHLGKVVVDALLPLLRERGLALAVQGCEHINRALVVERSVAEQRGFEIVTVVPALGAGGATALAAYQQAEDPVMVEHVLAAAGIDIGDTAIGMHVKFVQIPVRTTVGSVGRAHVTCLRSRPKLIGGERARYSV